ncbi:glycine receptor subunit alpha alkaliphile [Oratosquilla oratoria]|uniref:glycine receptor subunit alpha alkaliphile n=1 Tax=Oratosquilla oratoria TaxID=337810 RepID=UPI003F7703D7
MEFYSEPGVSASWVFKYRPPTDNKDPTQVSFAIFVQDINSINAEDMDFRVDLFLHMTWEDARLMTTNVTFVEANKKDDDYEYITLPSYVIDHIWTPDPFVTNSKDAAITKLTTTYASVTLFKNQTVRYSARVYSIVACQMEFIQYPMDVQICSIIFESFMYTPKEVMFQWRPWDPVMINEKLKLLQFSLAKPLKNRIEKKQSESGCKSYKFSNLVIELQFSREIGHHLVQTFVPSFLVVALSWFSFWLGLDAIPGRVTLLVTSLLTLTTLFTGIKEDLPPVAYVKAIDVWMAGCMVFVFAALGEFVIIKVIDVTQREVRVSPIQSTKDVASRILRPTGLLNAWDAESGLAHLHEMGPNEKPSHPRHYMRRQRENIGRVPLHWVDERTGEQKILWREIDRSSRMVFPVMFLLFMLIYFPILISRSF